MSLFKKWHCEHRILLNGRKTVIFS